MQVGPCIPVGIQLSRRLKLAQLLDQLGALLTHLDRGELEAGDALLRVVAEQLGEVRAVEGEGRRDDAVRPAVHQPEAHPAHHLRPERLLA